MLSVGRGGSECTRLSRQPTILEDRVWQAKLKPSVCCEAALFVTLASRDRIVVVIIIVQKRKCTKSGICALANCQDNQKLLVTLLHQCRSV
jgi:hypothetical protein